MTTPELLEYIRSQFAAGMTRDAIREALVKQSGWNPDDVEEGIRLVEAASSPATPAPLPTVAPFSVSADVATPSGGNERDTKTKSGR